VVLIIHDDNIAVRVKEEVVDMFVGEIVDYEQHLKLKSLSNADDAVNDDDDDDEAKSNVLLKGIVRRESEN
jgi:hypothetical protein